jgi:hypothetical protein
LRHDDRYWRGAQSGHQRSITMDQRLSQLAAAVALLIHLQTALMSGLP